MAAPLVNSFLRGDRPPGRDFRRARREQDPADRGRAAAPTRPSYAGLAPVAARSRAGSRAHDERCAAGPGSGGPPRGGAASGDGQSRHAPSRANAGVRPQPPACRRDRRHRCGERRGLRSRQAEHGGDPRLQRGRGGGSAGVREGAGRRAAVHRVHGRGRRHRLVHGPGRVPARDPGHRRPPLRAGRAAGGRRLGTGGAVRAAGTGPCSA